jgi:hypothetical protein
VLRVLAHKGQKRYSMVASPKGVKSTGFDKLVASVHVFWKATINKISEKPSPYFKHNIGEEKEKCQEKSLGTTPILHYLLPEIPKTGIRKVGAFFEAPDGMQVELMQDI